MLDNCIGKILCFCILMIELLWLIIFDVFFFILLRYYSFFVRLYIDCEEVNIDDFFNLIVFEGYKVR